MIFGILSHFIFVEKPMENHDFWNLEISRIAKTFIFPWFFAKNQNFDESASWWSGKKIFRGGCGGPKNEFKTPLWHAAIKIWGRLIRFLHFWWFDFLIFSLPQKMLKVDFSKNAIFAIFFSPFHQICSYFVIFHVFCLQNPFLLSKF